MNEGKKTVRIKLFKDNHNYTGDMFVSVNGENYLIKRGVYVDVPEYIAEVIESSQREDENAVTRMEKAEKLIWKNPGTCNRHAAVARAAMAAF